VLIVSILVVRQFAHSKRDLEGYNL